MFELEVLREEDVVLSRRMDSGPLHIGRGATNTLAFSDPQLSTRHATIWLEDGRLRVEDLGSRNGTFVNNAQITSACELHHGDRVRLGPNLQLRVRALESSVVSAFYLEDLTSGLRQPILTDRFRIGSGVDADFRLPTGTAHAATLLIERDLEISLGTDDAERQLMPEEPFEIEGRMFVVRHGGPPGKTEGVGTTRYTYRLTANLSGQTGPEAWFEAPGRKRAYCVNIENRATLLYVLARQWRDDRKLGVPDAQVGWCTDDDLVTGIWGREGQKMDPNNLHVLVCRLRKELADAGFDPWFLEKKKRHLRLRLEEVRVDARFEPTT